MTRSSPIKTEKENKKNQNQKENKNNEIVEEKEMDEWLYNMNSFFRDNDITYNPNQRTRLIVGFVQSGKTSVICGLAVKNVRCFQTTTIIVVRNLNCDQMQLIRNFQEGGRFGRWKVNVVYAGNRDTQVLAHAMENKTPSVIVALANVSQIQRLNQVAGRCENPSFDLILDEADDLGYKKKSTPPYIKTFLKLREKARQTTLITATCFTNYV